MKSAENVVDLYVINNIYIYPPELCLTVDTLQYSCLCISWTAEQRMIISLYSRKHITFLTNILHVPTITLSDNSIGSWFVLSIVPFM